MTRITPSFTGFALALLIAPLAAAQPILVQPASKSDERGTEHAATADQCKTLHDDYLKQKEWLAAKPADHDAGKHKADKTKKSAEKDLDQMRKKYEKRCGEPTADMGVLAGKQAAGDKDPMHDMPKKAGPAKGAHHASSGRCAQLHGSMKDALARAEACTKKEKACKKTAEDGYAQISNAYRAECGDIPDDAKPAKKKG